MEKLHDELKNMNSEELGLYKDELYRRIKNYIRLCINELPMSEEQKTELYDMAKLYDYVNDLYINSQ